MVQWNAECKPDGQMRRLVGSSFLLAAVPVNTECSESEPGGREGATGPQAAHRCSSG